MAEASFTEIKSQTCLNFKVQFIHLTEGQSVRHTAVFVRKLLKTAAVQWILFPKRESSAHCDLVWSVVFLTLKSHWVTPDKQKALCLPETRASSIFWRLLNVSNNFTKHRNTSFPEHVSQQDCLSVRLLSALVKFNKVFFYLFIYLFG